MPEAVKKYHQQITDALLLLSGQSKTLDPLSAHSHTCGFLSMAYVSSMMLEMKNLHATSNRKSKLAAKSQAHTGRKKQDILEMRQEGTQSDLVAVSLKAANQVSLLQCLPCTEESLQHLGVQKVPDQITCKVPYAVLHLVLNPQCPE